MSGRIGSSDDSQNTIGNSGMAIGNAVYGETEAPRELRYESNETMAEEAPTPMRDDSSSVRSINIEPLSSGYIVKVGCQTVAVETSEKLVKMLGIYLENPSEFERKWYSKDVRNRLENIN